MWCGVFLLSKFVLVCRVGEDSAPKSPVCGSASVCGLGSSDDRVTSPRKECEVSKE